jgi:hypothetical protein
MQSLSGEMPLAASISSVMMAEHQWACDAAAEMPQGAGGRSGAVDMWSGYDGARQEKRFERHSLPAEGHERLDGLSCHTRRGRADGSPQAIAC